MKRLALMILLAPAFLFGRSSIESLEQAIKDTDIECVEESLKNIQLTDLNKQRLLDLAQEIIKKRYSEWKSYAKSGVITLEEAAILLCGLASVNNPVTGVFFLSGLLATPVVCIRRIYCARKQNKLYKNAIEIKQLIYRSSQ